MSADTKQALEAAIEAHVHDECGDLAGAWVLVTETTSLEELDEGSTSYFQDFRTNQSLFLTLGLLQAVLGRSRFQTRADEDD